MISKSQITMTANDMTNTFSVTFENIELNRQIVITFKTGKWELIQFEDSIPSAWDTPSDFEYEQRHEKLEDAMMTAQTLINIQVEKSGNMQEISVELPSNSAEYEIEIYEADETDLAHKIVNALYHGGVRGDNRHDIGMYQRDNKSHSVFVFPADLGKAVEIINALGFETDEDMTA